MVVRTSCAIQTLLFTASYLALASGNARAEDRLIKVAVAGSAPFVVEGGGLAVDVWQRVAAEVGLRYEIDHKQRIEDVIRAVHSGQADIAVGPLSITASRTASVAFTQPYFRSRIGILANPAGPRLWDRIRPFVSTAFGIGVGFLLFVLFVVGNLIWLLERRANPDQFPNSYFSGVGSGVWLALVTMTTVGYGDKVPVSTAGRVVVGVWMVISMVTGGSLIASIASALTLAQLERAEITDVNSLRHLRVAVVAGTTGEDIARKVGGRPVPTKDISSAVDLLVENTADAVVGDLPVLQYHLRQHPSLPVALVDSGGEAENYGFALKYDDPLVKRIDIAVLHLLESKEIATIEQRWLGQ